MRHYETMFLCGDSIHKSTLSQGPKAMILLSKNEYWPATMRIGDDKMSSTVTICMTEPQMIEFKNSVVRECEKALRGKYPDRR